MELRELADIVNSYTDPISGYDPENPPELGRLLNWLRGQQNPPRQMALGVMPGGPGGFPQLTGKLDQAMKAVLAEQAAMSGGAARVGARPGPAALEPYAEIRFPYTGPAQRLHETLFPAPPGWGPVTNSGMYTRDVKKYPEMLEELFSGGRRPTQYLLGGGTPLETMRIPPQILSGDEVLREILSTGLLRYPLPKPPGLGELR